MCAKIIISLCIQFAVLDVAFSQLINRIIQNRGPITEALLPNNYHCDPYDILPNMLSLPNVVSLPNLIQPNLIQQLPNYIQNNVISAQPNIISAQPNIISAQPNILTGQPNIIQDGTVANSLANALQLLVVSSLLSNTLPTSDNVVYPDFVGPSRGVNYVY